MGCIIGPRSSWRRRMNVIGDDGIIAEYLNQAMPALDFESDPSNIDRSTRTAE